MIDRKEYNERKLKAVPKEELSKFLQAEVEANNLTNDIGWDYFLTIIQGILNQASEAKEYNRKMLDSDIYDHVELLKLKAAINRCDERITTLNMVLALPKQIKEKGKKAKALLEDSPIVSGGKSIFGRNR